MAKNANSNENPFGDISWVNQEDAVKVLPPTIQWRRGDKVNAEPFLKFGCWQLPKENWPMPLGDPWKEADCQHGGNVVVPSYITGVIHIAVINWRKQWFVMENDKRVFVKTFTEGARSVMQYYALVKEMNNEPMIITTSGLNAMNLENAVRGFAKQVIAPAGRMAGTQFGYYHFWIPLKTQGVKDTKQGQYVTPPGLALKDINVDVMRSLFTGKDIGDLASGFVAEAKDWAEYEPEPIEPEHEDDDNNNGKVQHPEPPPYDDAPLPDFDEVKEIPF